MEQIHTLVNLACAGFIAFGGLTVFQGISEIAKNRRQGGRTTSEEWWTIVEGAIWIALGGSGFLWQMISQIQIG